MFAAAAGRGFRLQAVAADSSWIMPCKCTPSDVLTNLLCSWMHRPLLLISQNSYLLLVNLLTNLQSQPA
jgi:hypothetical protein